MRYLLAPQDLQVYKPFNAICAILKAYFVTTQSFHYNALLI